MIRSRAAASRAPAAPLRGRFAPPDPAARSQEPAAIRAREHSEARPKTVNGPIAEPLAVTAAMQVSGQGRCRECWTAAFTQVSGRMTQIGAEHCKTVGSAYVGSNPTPATHFRRSEPVTRDCVTGFLQSKGAVTRTVGCVPWAIRGPDRAVR